MNHSCPETSNSSNESSKALKKLYLAIGLCAAFMVIEIVGGWWANSLAIISDAVHLLSDVAGFLTSVVAILVSRRAASSTFTFGFQRAQTLGAFASIAMVWLMTAFLVWEAIQRIKNPEEIDGKIMFITAAFGLLINLILAFSLGHSRTHEHSHKHSQGQEQKHKHEHKHDDINLRAAFIHVIGDLIQSAGVLVASALIWYRPQWRIADPICTFFFSVLVLGTTLFIFRDILRILMEGSPKGVNTEKVKQDIAAVPGVLSVHDLHIWTLSPGNIALTVHVLAESNITSSQLLHEIGEIICSKHGIHHSTIQIELKESFHCNPIYCAPRKDSLENVKSNPISTSV